MKPTRDSLITNKIIRYSWILLLIFVQFWKLDRNVWRLLIWEKKFGLRASLFWDLISRDWYPPPPPSHIPRASYVIDVETSWRWNSSHLYLIDFISIYFFILINCTVITVKFSIALRPWDTACGIRRSQYNWTEIIFTGAKKDFFHFTMIILSNWQYVSRWLILSLKFVLKI